VNGGTCAHPTGAPAGSVDRIAALTSRQALDVVDEWVTHPQVAMLHPGDGHWQILRDLVESAGAADPS
jgi:hypothetical protein